MREWEGFSHDISTMLNMWHLLLLSSALVGLARSECRKADWKLSKGAARLSTCENGNEYVNGFWQRAGGIPTTEVDILMTSWVQATLIPGFYPIEQAECCSIHQPWTWAKQQVMYTDWKQGIKKWSTCPGGYFLQGVERNTQNDFLFPVEYGRCSKPGSHPIHYQHCYDQDTKTCFGSKKNCKCNPGYFVAGYYTGPFNLLPIIEKLRCCKPRSKPDVIDEPYKARVRVMDETMSDMAYLAHYLGYGWCLSCRARYVGEDFRKDGDTWVADKTGECKGYMADQRLSIAYGHWSFGMKDIKYGTPVIEDLTPESIDSGTLINNDATEATKTISRAETSVRSVTHTTTSAWKAGHDLGVEISYSPPEATGGVGVKASYNFNYENSGSTTDENKKEQSKTFTVSTSKTLKPYSSVEWNLVLSKTRSTMAYTATILMRFSAELKGFLRWGGGYNGATTNYHYQHRGSTERPTVNYRFGDAKTPFYTALKRQSETNSRPWMWNDMENRYSSANSLIEGLTDENRYTFQLTGKFEDVIGKHCQFRWGPPTSNKGRKKRDDVTAEHVEHKNLMQIARAGADDPPAPTPDPPIVIVELVTPGPRPEPIAPSGA